MNTGSKVRRTLAVAVVAGLGLVGCGGDDSADESSADDEGDVNADAEAEQASDDVGSADAPDDDDDAGGDGGDATGDVAEPPTAPEGVTPFEQAEPGSGEGLKIGFIQLTLAAGFPQDVQASVEEQIAIAGAELFTCDSEADAAKAVDCARQFDVQRIDAQITFQADSNAAPSVCDAGPDVPVIAVDIVQEPCQTSFMGAANSFAGELVGYNVGLYFADEFDCEYDAFISLESLAVGEVNELRMGGIRDGFESVCGEIHDLFQLDSGPGGLMDPAQTLVTDTLTALPDAERIIMVGINEDVILGGIAAARTQGREDHLYLGVQNLNPDHCTIYNAPHWLGSVAYYPERYGELLVPYAIRAAHGEEIPSDLLIPHAWITSDNIDEAYPDNEC